MKSMEKQLTKYIESFEDIRQKVGDDQIALALLHELGKDRRMDVIRAERLARNRASSNGNGEQGASDKQRSYLKSLGVDVPEGASKAEASKMIDAALER